MDRLTKHGKTSHENGICCTHFNSKECMEVQGNCAYGCKWEEEVWSKLAEYEDLEEQGLILKLPYKAGDRVWILYEDKQIEENYVASIQIGEKYDRLCFADGYVYTIWNKDYEEAKKWVYTSKEEAEKALAEMKGE